MAVLAVLNGMILRRHAGNESTEEYTLCTEKRNGDIYGETKEGRKDAQRTESIYSPHYTVQKTWTKSCTQSASRRSTWPGLLVMLWGLVWVECRAEARCCALW